MDKTPECPKLQRGSSGTSKLNKFWRKAYSCKVKDIGCRSTVLLRRPAGYCELTSTFATCLVALSKRRCNFCHMLNVVAAGGPQLHLTVAYHPTTMALQLGNPSSKRRHNCPFFFSSDAFHLSNDAVHNTDTCGIRHAFRLCM